MLFGLGANNSKESSQVLDRGCGTGAGSVGFLEEKSQLIERERERVRVVGGRS
jgi:methylase of polypeptide subunit release factors